MAGFNRNDWGLGVGRRGCSIAQRKDGEPREHLFKWYDDGEPEKPQTCRLCNCLHFNFSCLTQDMARQMRDMRLDLEPRNLLTPKLKSRKHNSDFSSDDIQRQFIKAGQMAAQIVDDARARRPGPGTDMGPYDSLSIFNGTASPILFAQTCAAPAQRFKHNGNPSYSHQLQEQSPYTDDLNGTSDGWPLPSFSPSSLDHSGASRFDQHESSSIDSEVGVAISEGEEHWSHRLRKIDENIRITADTLAEAVQAGPAVVPDQSSSDTSSNEDHADESINWQEAFNTFVTFLQAPSSILVLCDILLMSSICFQVTGAVIYFTASPPPIRRSGRYTDPNFQTLCSTFCKETFALFVSLIGISKLTEPFVRPCIVTAASASFLLSVAALPSYFVYTTLGDCLMTVAGLLQVLVWKLIVLRWTEEDGKGRRN